MIQGGQNYADHPTFVFMSSSLRFFVFFRMSSRKFSKRQL